MHAGLATGIVVLCVSALGVLPHLRFSATVDAFAFIKNAYDEDTYFLFMLRDLFDPHRLLGHYVLRALYAGTSSPDLTLIACEVLLPALAAAAALFLATAIANQWSLRVLLTVLFLFGQDFLSLGNLAVWSRPLPSVEWSPGLLALWSKPLPSVDLFRALFGPWGATIVPSPEVSYLTLFRTPEPQLAYSIAFVALGLMVRIAQDRHTGHSLLLLAAVSALFPFAYVIVTLPTMLAEFWLACVLWCAGRRHDAAYASAIAAAVGTAFGVTIVMSSANQPSIFPSRLPIVTPGILLAASVLALAVPFLLKRQRSNAAAWLGVGCLALPIAVSNQQILTGFMVSARDWERSINYPFLILGVTLIFGSLVATRKRHWAAAVMVVGATLGLTAELARAQLQSYAYWLSGNLASVAMARAVAAVDPPLPKGTRIVLEDPSLAPLVAVRTRDRFTFVPDFTQAFLVPTPHMDHTGSPPTRPHEKALFEYWWRTGTSPAAARQILVAEAVQRGGYFLAFLFSFRDYLGPASDNRLVRQDEIVRGIPDVIRRYETYLAQPLTEQGTVVWLTSKDPAALATSVALANTPLSVGRAAHLTIHAYRQATRD